MQITCVFASASSKRPMQNDKQAFASALKKGPMQIINVFASVPSKGPMQMLYLKTIASVPIKGPMQMWYLHRVLKTADANAAMQMKLFLLVSSGQVFTDVVGSPHYVDREVLLKHYGPEADVWTAGLILYILLIGVPPFWAEMKQRMFDAVLKGYINLSQTFVL